MAASGATHLAKHVDKVQLRVMVNNEKNKVVYVKAGKDFVDVLFSFLTLPLGTIARLVSKESNIEAIRVGRLTSLYQSVADFDEEYLWTPACKEMLLNPRNSMADYCKKLKLNIDETEITQYFRCANWECNRKDSGSPLSTFRNQECTCGSVMNMEVFLKCMNLENGFVKEIATFIISDDLHVMPNVFGTIVSLLQNLGVNNNDTIEEQIVDITKTEVIDLLKLSLLSKTPLTDFILHKKKIDSNSNPGDQSEIKIGNLKLPDFGRKMDLKLMVKKSNGMILFAEAEEDFADFLFSFLTFPLGGVLHMLGGFTSFGCLNHLYKSTKELSAERYLISPDLNGKLAKPPIAPMFDLSNQILPIFAASLPVFYCHTYYNNKNIRCVDLTKDMVSSNNTYRGVVEKCVPFSFVDPKSSSSKSSSSGEFAKGPSTYMVTDNLVVTPMFDTSALCYLNRSKVSLSDLEEKVVKIGLKEGLAILKASLTSTTALTAGLNQLLRTTKEPVKKVKAEK